MSVEEPSARPRAVSYAVICLLLVIGIGMVQAGMVVLRHIEVRTPDFYIYTKVTVYAFSLLLLHYLGKGRNWARWLLVVILMVGIPIAVMPAFQSFFHYPLYNTLGVVQLVLYLIALFFLFGGAASRWFAQRRPRRP